jgi:hypothetical protein
MAYDEVERLLLLWAKAKAQKVIEEEMELVNKAYKERMDVAWGKENELNVRERAITNMQKRIECLELAIANKDAEARSILEDKRYYESIVSEYSDKAARFDAIREAIRQ